MFRCSYSLGETMSAVLATEINYTAVIRSLRSCEQPSYAGYAIKRGSGVGGDSSGNQQSTAACSGAAKIARAANSE